MTSLLSVALNHQTLPFILFLTEFLNSISFNQTISLLIKASEKNYVFVLLTNNICWSHLLKFEQLVYVVRSIMFDRLSFRLKTKILPAWQIHWQSPHSNDFDLLWKARYDEMNETCNFFSRTKYSKRVWTIGHLIINVTCSSRSVRYDR